MKEREIVNAVIDVVLAYKPHRKKKGRKARKRKGGVTRKHGKRELLL
jgi:hypothetical protein